jgi:hypothetical protein
MKSSLGIQADNKAVSKGKTCATTSRRFLPLFGSRRKMSKAPLSSYKIHVFSASSFLNDGLEKEQ